MNGPNDLGLPDKFSKWRPSQLDATIHMASADSRFIMVSAPPGVGKTVSYMAAHKIVGGRSLILTATKDLQDQLMEDFSSTGLAEIRGQSNYLCEVLLDRSAKRKRGPLRNLDVAHGPCKAGVKCDLKVYPKDKDRAGFPLSWGGQGGCGYYDGIRNASESEAVVTNYTWWITMRRFSSPENIGAFDTLIMDEAHLASDILARALQFTIKRDEVRYHLNCAIPDHNTPISDWADWAHLKGQVLITKLASLKARCAEDASLMAEFNWATDLLQRLKFLSMIHDWVAENPGDPDVAIPGADTDWILEKIDGGVEFSPVWAKGYAEMLIFGGIKRIVMVSATITKRDAVYLGVPSNTIAMADYPSPFKVENRGIHVIPAPKVGYKSTPKEKLAVIRKIDTIIDGQKNRKGLIHTVSYHWAQEIYLNSRHRDIMIVNDRGGAGLREAVDRFRSEEGPKILVSPAISTGLDFPYDQARYQIIAKVPFLSLGSPVVKRRKETDKAYYSYATVSTLMQMAGRIVRAEDDYGETYIVDGNMRWFWRQAQGMFSRWFKAAVR